jgi:5-methylcytosine-specific restriction enzyme A
VSQVRLCLELRCPNPATARGRCDEHRKPIERERSRRRREATNGIFKRRKWDLTLRAVLARDPICRVCENAISTEVDHITPLADGGADYDMQGLQGICTPCHQAKTATENAARARGRVET